MDLAGRTLRSIRRRLPGAPIRPEFFEPTESGPAPTLQHEDCRVIQMTPQERDPAMYPPTLPMVDQVLVDEEGHIWIRHFDFDEEVPANSPFSSPARDPDADQLFSVFEADGQLLGEVTIPSGLEVLEIGTDWVLALSLDDYDVPFVERYRLLKPAGGG